MGTTIEIDVTKLNTRDAYRMMIGAIVPRPIAWVSTISSTGTSNLAPFSFFTGVCINPPTLLFCPTNHPNGKEKDTLRNIRETREFVVNLVSEELAQQMNQSSADYPPEISEFQEVGLLATPSHFVKAPRVKESPINFECRLQQIITIGRDGPGSGHVVLGEIIYAHFAEGIYENGRVAIDRVKPIARLDGQNYCPVREVFAINRPANTRPGKPQPACP